MICVFVENHGNPMLLYRSLQCLLEKKCPALEICRLRIMYIVVILIYLAIAANDTFCVIVTVTWGIFFVV